MSVPYGTRTRVPSGDQYRSDRHAWQRASWYASASPLTITRSAPRRHPQLAALDLTEGKEHRPRHCAAVRAVAVESGNKRVFEFVGDGPTLTTPGQHSTTVELLLADAQALRVSRVQGRVGPAGVEQVRAEARIRRDDLDVGAAAAQRRRLDGDGRPGRGPQQPGRGRVDAPARDREAQHVGVAVRGRGVEVGDAP